MHSSFCSSIYDALVINDPNNMSIWHIMICTLSLLFSLSAYIIFRHNQNASTKNTINKNTILPLYEKLLLCYVCSLILTLFVWILELQIDSCYTSHSKYLWLSILCSFQTAIKRFFELFIILFISLESAGNLAIKQSITRSVVITIFLWITYFFIYTAKYIHYPFNASLFYIISEFIYCTIILFILWYCCCNHWLRMRNIYILLLYILIIQSFYILSAVMKYVNKDGHCLNDIADLLQIILFPLLIIYIIRADSYFWRTIFQTILESTRVNKVFGGNKISQQFSTRLSDDRGVFGYTPMTDFLSMKCPIIDFGNIKIGSNPVGYGSTSMVYPALLNGSQLVAVKAFTVEQITIKCIADFFRETLLSADINHPNIVKFLGCCIRPPEICLVYEICSHGDLSSFIFAQSKQLSDRSMRNSALDENIWNTPIFDTFDRSKYEQYNAHHLSSNDTQNDVLRAVDDDDFQDLDGQIDIIYPNTALLSDNTTILSDNQRWITSPITKKPNMFISPTQESSTVSSKYTHEQTAQEIVNSLKAKQMDLNTTAAMIDSVPILSMRCRLYLLRDIADGMTFLHKRNMLHRDLKTGNILVHYDEEQNRFLAKVCDFGSSRYVANNLTTHEPQIKGFTGELRRELSLTNYKNANKSRRKKKKKKIVRIAATSRKLRLNKKQVSYTEDSKSRSFTANSTQYHDTTTIDLTRTYDSIYSKNDSRYTKKGLLPEPIRNLSTVAYTAPENLGHIDFRPFERLYKNNSSPTVYRTRGTKIINEESSKIKKKYNCMTLAAVDITPLFEGRVGINSEYKEESSMSMDSEPIETEDRKMDVKETNVCVLNGNDVDLGTVFKSDVFSFGVIIWEIICMQPIYNEMNVIEIRDMILNGDRIALIDFDDLMYLSPLKMKRKNERKQYHKLRQLMSSCLKHNAVLRPNFEQIVQTLTDMICDM